MCYIAINNFVDDNKRLQQKYSWKDNIVTDVHKLINVMDNIQYCHGQFCQWQ